MKRSRIAVLTWMLTGCAAAQPALGPKVDQPGKLPGPASSVPDLAYDARLLSAFGSAQSFQGPLEGGWTLSAPNQGDLYAFQLTDGREGLGGAWRDLRKGRSPDASGVLDSAKRTADGLALRFTPPGLAPVTLLVRPGLKGELQEGEKRTAVVLRKTSP